MYNCTTGIKLIDEKVHCRVHQPAVREDERVLHVANSKHTVVEVEAHQLRQRLHRESIPRSVPRDWSYALLDLRELRIDQDQKQYTFVLDRATLPVESNSENFRL